MPKKPLILVTNDDGITAPGIRALISVMNQIGEVVVLAPDSPQSGMCQARTVDATIKRLRQKLGAAGAKHITTIEGFGYKFE